MSSCVNAVKPDDSANCSSSCLTGQHLFKIWTSPQILQIRYSLWPSPELRANLAAECEKFNLRRRPIPSRRCKIRKIVARSQASLRCSVISKSCKDWGNSAFERASKTARRLTVIRKPCSLQCCNKSSINLHLGIGRNPFQYNYEFKPI